MTRRPKSRLPPKLDVDNGASRAAPAREPEAATSAKDTLKRARVAGRSSRFGREELQAVMRHVADASPGQLLGLPPFRDLTSDDVASAVEMVFGWNGNGIRGRIGSGRCVHGFTSVRDRVLEVARDGGRLAFATGRPASLLGLHQALAAEARNGGGQVLASMERIVGPGTERLWWVDGVATLCDRGALMACDDPQIAEELLFCIPRPDLMVADRAFAGVALARGLEVAAFADLDAVALAVAAWRGQGIRIAPLDEHRPPEAYRPLLELPQDHGSAPLPLGR